MTREDAACLTDRVHAMAGTVWGAERLREWVAGFERSGLPYRHVDYALDRLFETMEPNKISLATILAEARKHPLSTWLPSLPEPESESPRCIPWREPPLGYSPPFPLERPNAAYRRSYRAQMARMREEADTARRERRSEGAMRAMRESIAGIARKWLAAPRHCDFRGEPLSLATLDEYLDWALTGPPEETEPLMFCNPCAPGAIPRLDPRVTPPPFA